MEQKVKRVDQYQNDYGLNLTLAVVGLPKSTWYYYQNQKIDLEDKYWYLKKDLFEIARKHPAYGKRRIVIELIEVGLSKVKGW